MSDRFVILEDWLRDHEGRWPLPPDLAGKIVLYEPNKTDADGKLVGMRGTHANRCVTPAMAEAAIDTGIAIDRIGVPCEGGARVLRLDQYQADWTFDYGVPPNPIVVDPHAPESTVVDDAEGARWRCGDERSHSQRVGRHGTYRFPFRSIEEAVKRARGLTPATNGEADDRRAGYGWTLLVEESLYSPGIDPGFPLRLQPFRRDSPIP